MSELIKEIDRATENLKKPVQKVSKPQIKPYFIDLTRIERELKEIHEQTSTAQAFPVALLDSQRLETIIMSTTKAYGQALQEALRKIHETEDTATQTIAALLKLKQENLELEREVLTKLKARLG